jgi:hypothetical protein
MGNDGTHTPTRPKPFAWKGKLEKANKFISHVLIERSGAWWHITKANIILRLRCAKYNDIYDDIIRKYIG